MDAVEVSNGTAGADDAGRISASKSSSLVGTAPDSGTETTAGVDGSVDGSLWAALYSICVRWSSPHRATPVRDSRVRYRNFGSFLEVFFFQNDLNLRNSGTMMLKF